jgi:MFS family permease
VRRREGSAFRHRDFAFFWVALLTSSFASQMATVAIGWQVYEVRGNPLDLGLVGLAEFLPLPLLALPAGQLADRVSRRAIYAFAVLMEIGVLVCLLLVTLNGADEVWPFFALAFAAGVAGAIGAPAGRALTPSLVPQEILVSALAHRSIAFQLALVAGPATGGVLFAIRPELVYAVAIAIALGALLCVLALRSGRDPAVVGAAGLEEVLAGVRLIRRTKVLLGAISLDLFAVLLGGAVALLPIFAKDILDVGPTGLGLLRTAPAVGSFAAALFLARRPVRRRAGRTLFLVVAAFGACMVVFGLSREMWLSMVALALAGAFDLVSVVLRSTILPLVTPDELRGRVNAVEMVFISASNELGAFESGVAAALIGAVPAVVVGGVATIAVALLWWRLFPSLARVDRLDELRPVEPAGASAAPG